MVIAILTPVRLFADSLAASLRAPEIGATVLIADTFTVLRESFHTSHIDIALIDVTQGMAFDEVRIIAARWPSIALLALGVKPEQAEVVRCARAGFTSYIPCGASIAELRQITLDVAARQLRCPPDVAGALFRALSHSSRTDHSAQYADALTARECDVLQELGHGRSNKEIARELGLSVSTIKHHVHSILEKLQVGCRAQAMRKVRDMPWMLGTMPAGEHVSAKLKKDEPSPAPVN
jgi:two-component system nitrate/nitrite response regulator NarL